jgi:hypothetical protein
MTMTQHETVLISWADAHQGEGHWATLEEQDSGDHIVETCGFIIPEQDGGKAGHVTIAQSHSPDDFYDHIIYIPTGMVRSITFLRPFTKDLPA